jgi:hypothetical protein
MPQPGSQRNTHQIGDGHSGDHPATATVTLPGGAILDRIIARRQKWRRAENRKSAARPPASYDDEKVKMALPTAHIATRNSSVDFNENLLENSATIGAPITTPKA